MKREEELTVSAAIEKLMKIHSAEHGKLGALLADDERDAIKINWQGGKVNGIGVAIDTLAAMPKREIPEDHGLPPYPTGDVVGACVCGSWPGGPCLKCEVVPAHHPKPEATEGATPSPLTCQCANTITDPCIVCGKGKTLVTAEWLQKMAEKEGDLEIGAGRPDYAAEADRLRAIALDMQNGYIALKGLVERAQSIISTSIYPNWHEAARAALTAKPETDHDQ